MHIYVSHTSYLRNGDCKTCTDHKMTKERIVDEMTDSGIVIQTFSISSASYTNSKSGRPSRPPRRTMRPQRSCRMYETRAMSDI